VVKALWSWLIRGLFEIKKMKYVAILFAVLLCGCAARRSVTQSIPQSSGTVIVKAAVGGHSVTLTWDGVSQAVYYNVYRKRRIDAAYTKIAAGVLVPTWDDATVLDGHTYDYVVTAVNATGQESGYSNVSKAVIPGKSGGTE
jgi:fibronectin type 3 domain-containing protein